MFNCCLVLHYPKIPEETAQYDEYNQDIIGDVNAYNVRFNDNFRKKTIHILWCSTYRPYTVEIRNQFSIGQSPMNHFVGMVEKNKYMYQEKDNVTHGA